MMERGNKMEFRVLQYFLAVTREQSISGAAQALHLSQPTLSRQLKDLEDELGKQLMIRGNRRITLTEEGMLLRQRAEEIMELVKKTESDISLSDNFIAGDITIGAGETDGIRYLARAAQNLQKNHPMIHMHIISGDSASVTENLDRGLIDFGLVFGNIDTAKYDFIPIPYQDTWGVIMRRDAPLSNKKTIRAEDLIDKPLILSRQAFQYDTFRHFFSCGQEKLNIVATYNLLYNGSLMVEEGMGYAISFDKLINTSGDSHLCFRPLEPELKIGMNIIFKKYQIFTKATKKFLQELERIVL